MGSRSASPSGCSLRKRWYPRPAWPAPAPAGLPSCPDIRCSRAIILRLLAPYHAYLHQRSLLRLLISMPHGHCSCLHYSANLRAVQALPRSIPDGIQLRFVTSSGPLAGPACFAIIFFRSATAIFDENRFFHSLHRGKILSFPFLQVLISYAL